MKMFAKIRVGLIALLLLAAAPAHATNGFWAHGYGTRSRALAGAGVALPLDGMDAASNPAKMVYLGDRRDLGAGLFVPSRGFAAGDSSAAAGLPALPAGAHDSLNELFLVPHFARNWMLDDNSSFGISAGANCGMNTEYPLALFAAFSDSTNPAWVASAPTGIDFKQFFVGLTYARKISPGHAFGITPIIGIQSLQAQGLEPFRKFSAAPAFVTNNGHDIAYGGGLRIGWLSRFNRLAVGLSYQTRLKMTKFDDYRGLLAGGGSFDTPPNLTFGIAVKLWPTVTGLFDIQHIWYEDIKAIANDADLVFTGDRPLLGTDDGLGFGWENMTIAKVGLQWDLGPDLALRAGFSEGNQVIGANDVLFNILTPAVITRHYTLGMTKEIKAGHELDIAILYAPGGSVAGGNPNTGGQAISLEMDQLEVEINWSRSF